MQSTYKLQHHYPNESCNLRLNFSCDLLQRLPLIISSVAIISQENSHEYTRFQDFYFHKTDTTQVLVAYIGSDSILQLPTTPEESHYNICDSVFYKNSNLKNITIPNCITSIGVDAFSGCNNLGAVYINDLNSWCKIDFNSETSNPLYYAENLYHDDILLTKIVIPNGVFRIKQYAFINCSNIGCIEII